MRWSDDEKDSLKVLFNHGYNDFEASDVLGRSPEGIRLQRYKLGLINTAKNPWTPEKDDVLLDPANRHKTNQELADMLGHDKKLIHVKRRRLKLPTSVYRRRHDN
jgi:hypothetical protein